MKNFEMWKSISSTRKKCEEFISNWQTIMKDNRYDKKDLTFSYHHDSGIRLTLAAYAGTYGDSGVSNRMPSNELVRESLVRVLNKDFPQIWEKVIEDLKSREASFHSEVKKELNVILCEIDSKDAKDEM